MNPSALSADALFPFDGGDSCEDSLTPYNLAVLVLVVEALERRKEGAATSVVKRRKKDEDDANARFADSIGVEARPSAGTNEPDQSSLVNGVESISVKDMETSETANVTESSPSNASSPKSCRCQFALLLLSLLQKGELDFESLVASVADVGIPWLDRAFKSRIHELLGGGVHALFCFRETSIEALLRDDADAASGGSVVHKSSYVGLFVRRMNLAFKTFEFPDIVRLYEKTVEYVSPAIEKASTGLSRSDIAPLKIALNESYKLPPFREVRGEDEVTIQAESALDESEFLSSAAFSPHLRPKHVSTPFVGPPRKIMNLSENLASPAISRHSASSVQPIPLTAETGVDEDSLASVESPDGGHFTKPALSRRQIEYFVATQVNALAHNEATALSPLDLQTSVNEMLETNPEIASLHYLSFLNAVRCHDGVAALHSLHHYFDRQHPKAFVVTHGDRSSAFEGTSTETEDHVQFPKNYRYGALNLAALHHRFSQNSEALEALRESIQMAQEAGDAVCLQHALGWLHLISEDNTVEGDNGSNNLFHTKDGSSLSEIITRGIKKSNELALPFLSSLGIQSLARQLALSKEPTLPCLIFDGLSRSDIVNCQHSILGLMSAGFAQKAALWRMYGRPRLASLALQASLQLNTCKPDEPQMGASEVQALVSLGEHMDLYSDPGWSQHLFSFLASYFPAGSPAAASVFAAKRRLGVIRLLGEGDFDAAAQEISALGAVDRGEAALLRGLLLLERGRPDEALDRLFRLLAKLEDRSREESLLRARVLTIIGDAFVEKGDPATAVEHFLKALTLSEARYHGDGASVAKVYLALAQYKLEMPEQARSTLDSCLLSVLTHGSLSLKAKTYFLKARCCLATTARLSDSDPQRINSYHQAVNDAERARVLFLQCNDFRRARQTAVFLATLFNHFGDKKPRNGCVRKIKEIELSYPSLLFPEVQTFRAF